MNVQVRHARDADLAKLVELHREVHELHAQARPDQFRHISDEDLASRIRELQTSNVTTVWVAELSGVVCGYLVAMRRLKPSSPYGPALEWCELDQIGVAEWAQRRGAARALLGAAVAEARAAGLQQIELNSWAFNRGAHRAFESLGFVAKSVRFELRG